MTKNYTQFLLPETTQEIPSLISHFANEKKRDGERERVGRREREKKKWSVHL